MRSTLPLLLLLSLWLPGRGQSPFTYALAQDTNVNLTRPRVFERIGPDLYRVFGGSGNNDSAWTYSADIDALGQLSNMRTMRCGVNTTNAMPSCMLRTSDLGMLVAFGQPGSSSNAFSFVKLDANGSVEWYRDHPGVTGHHLVDSQRALVEKDGHYFGLGRFTAVPNNEGNATTLLELDSAGACVAERIWAGGDTWSGEGQGIVRTADNGLIAVALEHYYWSNSSWPNLSVQKWTPEMEVGWSNKYSLGYMHGGIQVLATSDGGALITGYVYPSMGSSSYPFFLRLSGTGDVLWARRVTTPLLVPQGAVEEPDGGFALCLYQPPGTPIIARLGADGALSSAQLAAGAPSTIIPWGIERDTETGEHLVRASGGPSNTTYLLRLDSTLAFACWGTPFSWADTLVSAGVTSFPVSVTTGQSPSTETAWTGHPGLLSAVDACLSTFEEEEEDEAPLAVWPVPTTGPVQVRWTGPADVRCTVLDGMGRAVRIEQVTRGADGNLLLDLGEVGAGPYVLRLQGTRGIRSVRVVKIP